jgi:hypothetical protein
VLHAYRFRRFRAFRLCRFSRLVCHVRAYRFLSFVCRVFEWLVFRLMLTARMIASLFVFRVS